MIKCNICNENFEMNNARFLQWHVLRNHNATSKEYYDLFVKKPTEGVCLECGLPTRFITYSIGYLKYCSINCVGNNAVVKTTAKKTKAKKYGNETYNNREKATNTLWANHGVINVSQLEDIKAKKQQTTIKNYGVENPLQNEIIRLKSYKTKMKRYGDKNYNNREKAKETILLRYGVDSYSKTYQYRKYKENLQQWIPEEQLSDFKIYFRNVWRITKRSKKELYSRWNGKCYYTGKKLLLDVHYNDNEYPSIDHKTSIYYGFVNNISAEQIGSIKNLCICSRIINTNKNILCEKKFKIKLKK
jgi:hypothetical protein